MITNNLILRLFNNFKQSLFLSFWSSFSLGGGICFGVGLFFLPLDVFVWGSAGFSIDLDIDWLFICGFILRVFLHLDKDISPLLS